MAGAKALTSVDQLSKPAFVYADTYKAETQKWKSQKVLRDEEKQTNPEHFSLIIQNVRGFTQGRRLDWMRAWIREHNHSEVVGVLIQETHVTSTDESSTLTKLCERANQHKDETHRLAFWSIGADRTGGVGILVFQSTPTIYLHGMNTFGIFIQ